MKNYFTLIVLLLSSTTMILANQVILKDQQKVMTDVRHLHGQTDTTVDRSLNAYIIDIWADTDMNNVSLYLHNIGYSNIYIVDTNGRVINETSVYTNSPIVVDISTATCNGDFYVIVYSEYIYAEGYVSK